MITTILVPTDYSDVSINAVDYAVAIAKLNKAKVILLHVFQIPENYYNFTTTSTKEQLHAGAICNLEIIREMVHQKYNDVAIECEVRYGIVEKEISNYLKENTIDLLVMGIKKNGYLAKRLFGGVIPFSLSSVHGPVLVIENGIKLKRLVLAYKNEHVISDDISESFKEVVLQYKSRVFLLKIMSEYKYAAMCTKEGVQFGQHLPLEEKVYSSYNAVSDNGNFMVKMDAIPIVSRINAIYQQKVYIRNPKQNNSDYNT